MKERDWNILTVGVKTSKSVDNMDLSEDLKIDPTNINEAFCEQPSKYAWWSTVAIQAKSLVDAKKAEIERLDDYLKKTLIGELDTEVRANLEMNGEKITESKVLNGIYVHQKYKDTQAQVYELKSQLLELQKQWAMLDIAKESMNQRKDMLISLGAQLRLEGGNLELIMKDRASEILKKRQ